MIGWIIALCLLAYAFTAMPILIVPTVAILGLGLWAKAKQEAGR